MTNEKLWVFTETFLTEDGNTKGTGMVSIQKCSKQSNKTMREDESWLHLTFHSLTGVFACFQLDIRYVGRYLCELCVCKSPEG